MQLRIFLKIFTRFIIKEITLSEPRNVPQEPQGSAECNLSTTGLLVPTYTFYSTGLECAGT